MSLPKFEVSLQPTEAQINAGVEQLLEDLPGIEDNFDEQQLQDAVVFVW